MNTNPQADRSIPSRSSASNFVDTMVEEFAKQGYPREMALRDLAMLQLKQENWSGAEISTVFGLAWPTVRASFDRVASAGAGRFGNRGHANGGIQKRKYPWREWVAAGTVVVERFVDFEVHHVSFRVMANNYGRNHGLSVSMYEVPDETNRYRLTFTRGDARTSK